MANASAIARPNPREPPVTSATLPSIRNRSRTPLISTSASYRSNPDTLRPNQGIPFESSREETLQGALKNEPEPRRLASPLIPPRQSHSATISEIVGSCSSTSVDRTSKTAVNCSSRRQVKPGLFRRAGITGLRPGREMRP